MTSSHADLQGFLQQRSQRVVEGWYRAVRTSAVALHAPSEVRAYLSQIWDRMAAFLLQDDAPAFQAESLGAAFIRLRIRSEAMGEIQRVLLTSLLEDSPADVALTVQARLPDLMAGIVGGMSRAAARSLLEQQEEIREAYARSLRRAEEELRIKNAGIESSINGIAMLDLDGQITYVNPSFLKMWGYQSDHEVVGVHVSHFGHWEGDVHRALTILSKEGGFVRELEAVRGDGSRFDVQASVSAVRNSAGRPVRLMCFFLDITERKKTQEALRRRAVQAAFLNEIGEEIAGERTAERVMERAVRLAQDTFDFHQVSVLLFDPEREELTLGALANSVHESPTDMRPIPLGEGITGWVAQQQRSVVSNDVSSDPRHMRVFPSSVAMGSELAVPICRGGHFIGVLDVQSPVQNAFGGGEQIVLETLADQIAVALENARLYQALQEELAQRRTAERALRTSVQRLETVHEIDQAILGAKSKEDVAEALLRNVRRLVPCQRASIDLFDLEANEVIVIAAVQTVGDGRAAAGTRFPLTLRQQLLELLGQHQVGHIKNLRHLPQSSPAVRTLISEGFRSILVGPITAQGELIGALSLGSCEVDGFALEHEPIVKELADTAGIAIQQARLFDSVRQQRERLRRTMARLAEVEETERRRVVRELHDQVGQNLTALDLNLSLVRSQLEQRGLEDLGERLQDSLSLVEQTNRRIRRLMIDLRPPVLDDYGLLSALHWYGDRFSGRTGIAVAVKGKEETASNLSPHVENALFRIAQEALNNAAKHAGADMVTVALTADETAIQLTIKDDGAGFRPEDVEADRTSWGLLTMRERAESVGAQCYLASDPENGTRVTVEVPK